MSESSKYTNEKNDGNEVLSGRQNENPSLGFKAAEVNDKSTARTQAHEAAALSQGCVEAMKGLRSATPVGDCLFPHPRLTPAGDYECPKSLGAEAPRTTRITPGQHTSAVLTGPRLEGGLCPHLQDNPLALSPLELGPNRPALKKPSQRD